MKKWYFVIPEVTSCTKRAVAVVNITRERQREREKKKETRFQSSMHYAYISTQSNCTLYCNLVHTF